MRRDIQGLRAFAVLVVVLYRGQLGFGGGFVGVDVFFVISGYVIAGVLIRDSPSSLVLCSTLARFYARRIRRLLPALGAIVIVVPRVILRDPMKYLCTGKVCPNGDDTGPWYSDNDHIGPRWASRLDEPLKALLTELAEG